MQGSRKQRMAVRAKPGQRRGSKVNNYFIKKIIKLRRGGGGGDGGGDGE